jgi:hypothetical protein
MRGLTRRESDETTKRADETRAWLLAEAQHDPIRDRSCFRRRSFALFAIAGRFRRRVRQQAEARPNPPRVAMEQKINAPSLCLASGAQYYRPQHAKLPRTAPWPLPRPKSIPHCCGATTKAPLLQTRSHAPLHCPTMRPYATACR